MTQIPFRFLPLETGHWQLVTRGAAAFGHWDFGIGHSLQPADCKLQTGPLDLASVSPYPAPHMNVTIRRAVPADYEAICELAEIMDAPQRGALPDRFRKPEGPVRLRNRTEALMRDRDTFLAVAEIDGRVVGVVNAGLEQMPDYPQKQPLTSVLVRGISVRADCPARKSARRLSTRPSPGPARAVQLKLRPTCTTSTNPPRPSSPRSALRPSAIASSADCTRNPRSALRCPPSEE